MWLWQLTALLLLCCCCVVAAAEPFVQAEAHTQRLRRRSVVPSRENILTAGVSESNDLMKA
jgi:hypothetical protein